MNQWMTDPNQLQNRAFAVISAMAHKHPMRFLLIGLVSGMLANRLMTRHERQGQTPSAK